MTLRERARLATAARQQKARSRAERFNRLLEQGECKKRAAFRVGVSLRTATRYKRMA